MTALTEALPLLLLRAREHSLAFIRPVLQDQGLTEPQWRVLHTLYLTPNLSAHSLAQQSCILSPSLSRILARFDADGLILRNVSSADQRSVSIKLSAKGRRLCERLLPKLQAQYDAMLHQIGEKPIEDLTRLLEAVIVTSEHQ